MFIGMEMLFVFCSYVNGIMFVVPFEIEIEIVLQGMQSMLYAVVAVEFTGVAFVALYLFVDADFHAEAFFKTIHELGERLVFEIVDTVFPQFRLERADDRLLEFAVFELSAVARFEGRVLSPDEIFTEPSMSDTMKSFSSVVEVT